MAALVEQLEALIAPRVVAMGYDFVQLKLMEGSKTKTLQIMAERPDGSMTVDDCADISRQISAVLDVEDVIPGEYRLEVSSPGIDRPLVREKDYTGHLGHTAKVETVLPVNGRKRYTGTLKTLEGGVLTLTVDTKDVQIALNDIQSAKLVLTDALIKQHLQKQAS